MAAKRLLVVVNSKTEASWHNIIDDQIGMLARAFCGNKPKNANETVLNTEFALVEVNARGSSSSSIKPSKWTTKLDEFLKLLHDIEGNDADCPNDAIAEGLTEALKSFGSHNQIPSSPIETQQNEGLPNHCILVANKTDPSLSAAVTVARSFPQYSISLSVICPKELKGFDAIFKAGQLNPSSVDQTFTIVNGSSYVLLVSEDLKTACDNLTLFPASAVNERVINQELGSGKSIHTRTDSDSAPKSPWVWKPKQLMYLSACYEFSPLPSTKRKRFMMKVLECTLFQVSQYYWHKNSKNRTKEQKRRLSCLTEEQEALLCIYHAEEPVKPTELLLQNLAESLDLTIEDIKNWWSAKNFDDGQGVKRRKLSGGGRQKRSQRGS